ncbi:MAG: hypothetical protein QOE13_1440 [Gaiellaceae bacterium]|jgi:hypothetical protein|nr:hypothetical protein [Gaiellaceae bacterium]
MRIATEDDRRSAEVARWRREQLIAAGFSLPLASRLARDEHWDIHALIELVERGCRPDVAARILAPLQVNGDAA